MGSVSRKSSRESSVPKRSSRTSSIPKRSLRESSPAYKSSKESSIEEIYSYRSKESKRQDAPVFTIDSINPWIFCVSNAEKLSDRKDLKVEYPIQRDPPLSADGHI